MVNYKNRSGNSSVEAYEYGDDYILIKFKNGSVYEYTINSAGLYSLLAMKKLADAGSGLGSYISRIVKKGYNRKLN